MKNILVLEDDPANLQVFVALLWSKGHNVLEASTAREALVAARREERLNLLVSDVALKGDPMSGTEVATVLVDGQGVLPIIFVTGTPLEFWDESDRQNLRALRLGNSVVILEKPFMPLAFQSTVDSLLRQTDIITNGSHAASAKMFATGSNARPISERTRSASGKT